MFKKRIFSSRAALFVSALLVAGAALLFSACENGGDDTAPSAPAQLTVTAGTEQLSVTWVTVEDAEYYEVYYGTSETGDKTKWGESHTGTSVTITDLTGGILYYVWIKAGNASGVSGFSKSATGTPAQATESPAVPVITVTPGNATLIVTWETVTGAASYELYYAADATAPGADTAAKTEGVTIDKTTGTTATITGLTNGTEYSVYVRAKNSIGPSAWSEPVATAPYDPSELADLAGPWVSSWGEEFTIVDGEFISAWGGYPSYKGTIVHIRKDDGSGTAGYLTIRYTENANSPGAAGNYYVIRWEGLVSNVTISIAAGWNSAAIEGFATLAEAEAGYTGTIGNGSFAVGSDCFFTNVSSQPSAIQGSWTDGGDPVSNDYTITDKLVMYSTGGTTMFVGEIVNVRTSVGGGDHNYITFKFITNDVPSGASVGEYCVLYWTNLDDAADPKTVKMSVANDSTPGDTGAGTQNDAETEYTIDDSDYYYQDIGELTQPPPPSY